MTGRRGIAAALALVVVAVGCGGDAPHALEPIGQPYATSIVLRDTDHVFVYSVRRFRVLRPVTVRWFRPATVPPEVTVLTSRASFFKSTSGRATTNGYPAAFCTDAWPMAGFGPTYQTTDLRVDAGDVVTFTVYVRAQRPGDFVLDGYDLGYDDGGVVRSLRTEQGQRADVRVLAPDEVNERPPCDGTARDRWMQPARQ